MYTIETSNLKKHFISGKKKIKAVDGIDLKIERGEIYGLLGPNGAGKTTTLYMLSTLLLPTSGKAYVLGFDVVKERQKIREKVNICIGTSSFYWFMKPPEVLNYFARLYGIKKSERKKRIGTVMEDLDMIPFKDKQIMELSTGMIQKVAIAKSLLNNPEVLFLDEPTNGLDVEIASSVRNYVFNLVKENQTTVILTSHRLDEVEQMCKKIAIIDNGKIVAEGPIKEIKKRLALPDIVTFYLENYKNLDFLKSLKDVIKYKVEDGLVIETKTGLATAKKIEDLLKKNKIKVNDVEIRKASLEEAFLKIIRD